MSQPNDSAPQPAKREHVRVRAWHIILLVIAVICTILLAWWQWTRFQSGSGTFQNLGYALQWPFFGAFFVYAYRMGLKMENEKIDAINSGATMDELYEADLQRFGGNEGDTAIDDSFLPSRPELDVDEFNALNVQRRGADGHAPDTTERNR